MSEISLEEQTERQKTNDLSMAKSCLLMARDMLEVFKNTKDEQYAGYVRLMCDRAKTRMKPYIKKEIPIYGYCDNCHKNTDNDEKGLCLYCLGWGVHFYKYRNDNDSNS